LEDVALVRERISRFGRNLMVAVLGIAVLRFAVIVAVDVDVPILDPYLLLAGAVFAALWLTTRTDRGWTLPTLRALESGAFVASSGAFAVMALKLPHEISPELVLLLTLSYGLILRTVLVPSSVTRTVVLGGVLAVPLGLVVYLCGEPPWLPRIVFMTAWWGAGTFVAGVTSRVVYGLRRQVRRAMRLGQYALEEQLGRGGMGVVYRARHGLLKRPTAVKVLRPDHHSDIDIARFEREVQLTAQLTHPNTVKIYDYGRTDDGLFFYAMELLDGASLDEVVTVDGAQPPGRVAHILLQVAGALAEAHEEGVIHRDIKPSNIILAEQGGEYDFAKVVDFGLVKQLKAPSSLTAENALIGTPLYLAPEAIRTPDQVDARVDIYAFGAVGYYLLTASEVFDAGTVVEVCTDHLYAEPEPPSERLGRAIPEDLEDLVLSCLAKDPDDRPQSADELVELLEPIAERERWTRRDAERWWETHQDALEQHRAHNDEPVVEEIEHVPPFIAAARSIRAVLMRPSQD
jgi:serine/threonine-protein kinase